MKLWLDMSALHPTHTAAHHGHGCIGDDNGGGAVHHALRLILAFAVQMTGAQGAVVSRVSGRRHIPLVSMDLSRPMVAIIAEQLGNWRIDSGCTSTRLIQCPNRSPMFALCTAAEGPAAASKSQLVVSLIMTAENHLERCSLTDLETLAAEMVSLLVPARAARPAHGAKHPAGDVPLATCCMCEDVQSDDGEWLPWQRFLQEAEGRMLSHTFCPRCLADNYPELVGSIEETC